MSKKGFTLVELMVVILIVAILAAVAIPIMRGRVDAAKWSEGKAMMGTIATGIRAYVAEIDSEILDMAALSPLTNTDDFRRALGFREFDLQGTYFVETDFDILSGAYNPETNILSFLIEGTKNSAAGIGSPTSVTLDQTGTFTISGI